MTNDQWDFLDRMNRIYRMIVNRRKCENRERREKHFHHPVHPVNPVPKFQIPFLCVLYVL